jgi:hypothetical protein
MRFTTHFELHSQTTRLFEAATLGTAEVRVAHGVLTLHDFLFQGNWTRPRVGHSLFSLQLWRTKPPDFKLELFPLHSPLLGESLLVSVPRLIDMLKFRR